MKRSHRWSIRSLNSFELANKFKSMEGSAGQQSLYGIIQGGIFQDLRDESIDFNLNSNNFFGLAIGGSLGRSKEEMHQIVEFTASKLKDKHPIHLLGIGDPSDIWSLVRCGVDTFDCVSPTRLARHGAALKKTRLGKINIENSKYRENLNPIDSNCHCETCAKYSLSYLHHLLKADELLGLQLITSHNIYFMNDLMLYIRTAINEDKLLEAEKDWYQD